MSLSVLMHLRSQVEEMYHTTWNDFLSNHRDSAVTRVKVCLKRIEQLNAMPELHKDDALDLLITKADMLYIKGACEGDNETSLQEAVAAYDEYIKAVPGSRNAHRMKGEALLRLHQYDEAWLVFDHVAHLSSQEPLEELEVAPFRLRFDADHFDMLVTKGLVDPTKYSEAAENFRQIATYMNSNECTLDWNDDVSKRLRRTRVKSLPGDMVDKLSGFYNQPIEFLLKADKQCQEKKQEWTNADPLNPLLDWSTIAQKYEQDRLVIIDNLFSDKALQELWRYIQIEANFRTMRAGFLGAFPGDGTTHPIIRNLALKLEEFMPKAFSGHPLGLWWFFRYTDEAPNGIGIHADPAAVNINVWLTPDESQITGGGLEVFKMIPPADVTVTKVNHEFTSREEEAEFYNELAKDGITRIPYKCNRGAIFVSDQYHVSEPFEFKQGHEHHRVNLTLLFGDRIIRVDTQAAQNDKDAWDLFD